jgi:hypothetical protein
MDYTTVDQNGKTLIKKGRKIVAFVWDDGKGNGYSYAFGKPSDPSFIAWQGDTPLDKEGAVAKATDGLL